VKEFEPLGADRAVGVSKAVSRDRLARQLEGFGAKIHVHYLTQKRLAINMAQQFYAYYGNSQGCSKTMLLWELG
jgi:hypothetical protein